MSGRVMAHDENSQGGEEDCTAKDVLDYMYNLEPGPESNLFASELAVILGHSGCQNLMTKVLDNFHAADGEGAVKYASMTLVMSGLLKCSMLMMCCGRPQQTSLLIACYL